ncbi:hypothetical protein T06_6661 [Trichinella sp. T6]|nr:hypothetical protein T06_6661 [Trichinella sp. T6]
MFDVAFQITFERGYTEFFSPKSYALNQVRLYFI